VRISLKEARPNWALLEMPMAFWISTAVIILSSVTIFLARKSFDNREMRKYRQLMGVTALLGIVFLLLQGDWICEL
jgi:cytochrome c oxidase subunit 3